MDSRDDPVVTAARPKCPSICISVFITVRLGLMIIKTGLMCIPYSLQSNQRPARLPNDQPGLNL